MMVCRALVRRRNDSVGGNMRILANWATRAAKPLVIVSLLMLSLVGAQTASSATALGSPYSGTGYDTSYPQCSATLAPAGFAIIGIGHGRPFTTNTCAGNELTMANNAGDTSYSVYFNTGYALAYAKSETTNCQSDSLGQYLSVSGHEQSVLQQAWAIGCSEVDYAVAAATAAGLNAPVGWWADIESGNSWSTNTTVNEAAVSGISSELTLTKGFAGVYSSASMWNKIVGSSFHSGFTADWQAGLNKCPSSGNGFSLSSDGTTTPIWLAQYGSYSLGGATYDKDTAC